MPAPAACPDCGTAFSGAVAAEGLCPDCLMRLGLEDWSVDSADQRGPRLASGRQRLLRRLGRSNPGVSPMPAQDDFGADAPAVVATATQATETLSPGLFARGRVLGERYRVRRFLGRGGMGEVWHAFDLKLRVDVALKSVFADRLGDRALEALRREVRSAREVISPNVCRIFDLVEVDGHELVSMEYIDGTTLSHTLREGGQLELLEATEIASQFLSGLAAIHDAGLIHRDVKPDNIMITRTARVVLMDFGLAKPEADDTGASIAGTPAYMAPEQLRGDALDARADIFATGVVLAEMVTPGVMDDRESRATLHNGIRDDPPQLPDNPWRPVLRRALAREPAQRYGSAAELIRALEEVTLRVEGAEDLQPYPGLASFTAEDAQYFFGRELEIEAVWKKLRRPHLMGLIGPSGAGKTSFLRAGLLPAMPSGWQAVLCHPGDTPVMALGRVLLPEFAGDTDAMGELMRFDDPEVAVGLFQRWRKRHDHALVIVDQFEELFTLNPPDVQASFAELLSRLALEADVHVLLSMRDDFLFHCHEFPALRPLFSELTPLGPPTGPALRRALVQPALQCGFRFEDDRLVDAMLEEVASERGALPLLAFAVSQLWDHRDRQKGLLTREAYETIGGVGGALAQHAEATVERIGSDRLPLVRELFRNLVTAQGTRAVRDVDDLLSIFDDRERATEVLRALIDARLVTSFEYTTGEGDDQREHQRVEIIHESLIAAWPRLVRWRTQDEGSAQQRDQLRQATNLWHARGRADDLLWSGTSYKEFEVWRERYEGGLTESENAFATAMVVKAERNRRRRGVAAGAALVMLLLIIGVLGWSVREQRQARLAAEANNLLTLGRARLHDHPTEALAYTIASLEVADSNAARRFAQNVLWRGPTAFTEEVSQDNLRLYFSADGQWLFASGWGQIPKLWRQDGSPMRLLEEQFAGPVPAPHFPPFGFSGDGTAFVSWEMREGPPIVQRDFKVWSLPDLKFLRRLDIEPVEGPSLFSTLFWARGASDLIEVPVQERPVRRWSLTGGAPDVLDPLPADHGPYDVDASGQWLSYVVNQQPAGPDDPGRSDFYLLPLDGSAGTAPRHLGGVEGSAIWPLWFHPDGEHIATRLIRWGANEEQSDLPGYQRAGIRLWPLDPDAPESPRMFDKAGVSNYQLGMDRGGRWIAAAQSYLGTGHVWDRSAPAGADPWVLRRGKTQGAWGFAMHPEGTWVALADQELSLWPLGRTYPHVLRHAERTPGNDQGGAEQVFEAVVDPGGEWVATSALDNAIWLWPLEPAAGHEPRLLTEEWGGRGLEVSPDGRYLLTFRDEQVIIVSVADGSARKLEGVAGGTGDVESLAFDPTGSFVVGGGQLWDLHSEEPRTFSDEFSFRSEFLADGRLLTLGKPWNDPVLRLWDLDAGETEIVYDGSRPGATPTLPPGLEPAGSTRILSPDGRHLLLPARADDDVMEFRVFDLERGEPLLHLAGRLSMPTSYVYHPVWHPSGRYVLQATLDGPIEIVPLDGSASYLLFGHEGIVTELTATPDGNWIVSAAMDGTARIWPMPEGMPLQALPYEELLPRLRALTNYRVEEDEDSPTGFRVGYGRLPAWDKVPTW